jgi:hypothetical protein
VVVVMAINDLSMCAGWDMYYFALVDIDMAVDLNC